MGKNSGQIQRIQSIYLLLAAIVAVVVFFVPFGTSEAQADGMLMDGDLDVNDNIGLLVLTVSSILVSVGTIFLFNNRTLQMNLGKLNILLLVVLLGLAGYLYSTVQSVASVGVGLVMPVAIVSLVVAANAAIKKDEKQVRSADRLR